MTLHLALATDPLDLAALEARFLRLAHEMAERAEGRSCLGDLAAQRTISLLWEWRSRFAAGREPVPVLRRANPGLRLDVDGEWEIAS